MVRFVVFSASLSLLVLVDAARIAPHSQQPPQDRDVLPDTYEGGASFVQIGDENDAGGDGLKTLKVGTYNLLKQSLSQFSIPCHWLNTGSVRQAVDDYLQRLASEGNPVECIGVPARGNKESAELIRPTSLLGDTRNKNAGGLIRCIDAVYTLFVHGGPWRQALGWGISRPAWSRDDVDYVLYQDQGIPEDVLCADESSETGVSEAGCESRFGTEATQLGSILTDKAGRGIAPPLNNAKNWEQFLQKLQPRGPKPGETDYEDFVRVFQHWFGTGNIANDTVQASIEGPCTERSGKFVCYMKPVKSSDNASRKGSRILMPTLHTVLVKLLRDNTENHFGQQAFADVTQLNSEMQWGHRGPHLLKKMLGLGVDILALEEVDMLDLEMLDDDGAPTTLRRIATNEGYTVLFFKTPGRPLHPESNEHCKTLLTEPLGPSNCFQLTNDGVALLLRTNRFEIFGQERLMYDRDSILINDRVRGKVGGIVQIRDIISGEKLLVVAAHLMTESTDAGASAGAVRAHELTLIRQVVEERLQHDPSQKVILMADFNTDFKSAEERGYFTRTYPELGLDASFFHTGFDEKTGKLHWDGAILSSVWWNKIPQGQTNERGQWIDQIYVDRRLDPYTRRARHVLKEMKISIPYCVGADCPEPSDHFPITARLR